MLITGIADAIQEMCSCNFTSSDLEESEATCSTNDNTTMTFTTTVVYSTESGDMTASTLIQMFQDRAASTSTVISVGSQTATIVSVCNPFCTVHQRHSLVQLLHKSCQRKYHIQVLLQSYRWNNQVQPLHLGLKK